MKKMPSLIPMIEKPSVPIDWKSQLLQLEQENQAIASFFQKIIDIIPGYFYWKNDKGVYLGCNRFVLDFYHFNSNMAIIGNNDAALCAQYATELEANDRKVMQTGETLVFEETILGFRSRSIKMPLKDEHDNIVGVIGNSLDTTTNLQAIKRDLIETRALAEASIMLCKNQFPFFKPNFFF